jgi:hypothetical protein
VGVFAGPEQQRINVDLNANNSVSFSLNNFPNADNYKIKVDGFLGISTTTSVGIVTISPGLTRNVSIEAYSGLNLLFTANKNIKIFDYVGIAQSWTTPANVKYLFADVQGAQGGDSGGAGGRAKSYISVASSETLYFYCGGAGGSSYGVGCTSIEPAFVAGGFNGGGRGGGSSDAYLCGAGTTAYGRGASGGGASDIRRSLDDLSSRTIVAGGGGGGPTTGYKDLVLISTGGCMGGGENGVDGGYSARGSWDLNLRGKGATTTAAGIGGTANAAVGYAGTVGIGGSGSILPVFGNAPGQGSGGGGGYFGGGGGGAGSNFGSYGGGGGGSGYIDAGFKSLISSSGFGSITSGYRSGNGRIMIAWDSITPYSDIVTSGLVLNLDAQNYYSYPGSGTTWTDLSGNNNTGTLTNGPTYSSANGGSLVFDGTNDYAEVITRNTNLEFQPTLPYSSFCWVYNLTNVGGTIISNMQNTGTYPGWDLYLQTNEIAAHLISSWSTNAIKVAISFDFSANANKWVNIGYTYNGTSPANATDALNSINFYLNGVLMTTGKNNSSGADGFNTTSETITYNTSQRLRVASRWTSGAASTPGVFSMSNCLLYNRALTAAEIQQNYNATKSRYGL